MTGEFPAQRASKQKMFPFDDIMIFRFASLLEFEESWEDEIWKNIFVERVRIDRQKLLLKFVEALFGYEEAH